MSTAPERSLQPALVVENLRFAYGQRPVLQDVSIEVPAGTFCVLLGVNGAGKTTLFSLLTRLFLCHQGRISILGSDLRNDRWRALAQLGVVFQQPTLDLDLSLDQNLRYFCVLQGIDPVQAQVQIERALDEAGLSERRDDKARQLSGGQRRRLELARALLHQPRLLLADEPTVGLDIHSRQAIIHHVREECRDRGVGVLWATHLVDEVQDDDQVIVLHHGRVLSRGSAESLKRDTGSDTVAQAFNRLTRGGDA